jgi:hypothetical protein
VTPIYPDIYSNMWTSNSEADDEPLGLNTKDGVPYQRRPAVEMERRAVLLLPESEWLRNRKKYRPETLVHLIQKTRLGDPRLYGDLLDELGARVVRLARKGVRGRNATAAQDIVGAVRAEILCRAITNNGFLEVSFAGAVADCLIDASKAYDNSISGNRRGYIFENAVDDDGDEIERPMELLLSHYPSPEEAVIALRQQERRRALLDIAASKVKDPRHLEAVVLRVVEDIPITSDDPDKDTLTNYFGATVDQIKYWVKAGLQALRRALEEIGVQGVQND